MEELGVVKYDITEAAIAKMKTDFMVLTVQGLDDEAGFKMVHEARMVVKDHRVAVEKKRVNLKAGALEYGRKVDSEAKRITALLAPIETHLQTEEDKVTKEKERIRTQKILDEQARVATIRAKIQEFKDVVADVGPDMPSDEIQAVLDVINGTGIHEDVFQEFTQEALLALSASRSIIEARHQHRLEWEDEQAKAKAESERLEKVHAEQEAEAKRLEDLRKATQEALDAERRLLASQKAALEEEKAAEQERKMKGRANLLFSIGLGFDGEQYKYADINVHWTDIVTLSDTDFDVLIEELRPKVVERKTAEANKIKDQADADAIENARQKAEEAEAKAAVEAAEKARQEALRPIRDKLLSFADAIATLPLPDVTDPVAGAILEDAIKTLTALARKIRKSAKEL